MTAGNSLKEKTQKHFELNTNREAPNKNTLIQESQAKKGDMGCFFF